MKKKYVLKRERAMKFSRPTQKPIRKYFDSGKAVDC